MKNPHGQNLSSIWRCLLELYPQTHLHEPKKQLFLLVKIENSKYPEAETWHQESIDGRYLLMRIPDDALAQPHGGNLDPIWLPYFFLLNFTRFLWFFWDLAPTLFDIPKGTVLANILISSKFLVFQQYIGSQNGQNHKLSVRSIWVKFSKFWRIFQTMCLPYWITSGQNFIRIEQ